MFGTFDFSRRGRMSRCLNQWFRPLPCSATIGILLICQLTASPSMADGGAVTTVVPEDFRFFCGNTQEVTYGYTPDLIDTPVTRGYSIQISTPQGLTFDQGDIYINSPLVGVKPARLVAGNFVLDLRDVNNRPLEFDLHGKSDTGVPTAFALSEAYPNPSNPATTISFSRTGEMPVRLEIYGTDGRRVASLVDETLSAEFHETVWLGRDNSGRQVAAGVYFSKLRAGSQSQVRKMTLMKLG